MSVIGYLYHEFTTRQDALANGNGPSSNESESAETLPNLELNGEANSTVHPPSRIPNEDKDGDANSNDDDDDDDADDDDEEQWQELNEDGDSGVRCLFCEAQLANIHRDGIKHLHDEHGFDLPEFGRKFDLDCYGYIKLVNYIRAHRSQPTELLAAPAPLWNDEQYMKPAEYEHWLTFDYDTLTKPSSVVANQTTTVKTERQQIEELLGLLHQKDALLEEAAADISRLRSKLRELFDQQPPLAATSAAGAAGTGATASRASDRPCVASVPVDQDSGYFQTYAHYGIHHEMLSDVVRTSSYRDAIVRNAATMQDKIVLDLGCGTSILSMFAARSGARRIYAVDQSDIIYKAMDIVRTNGIDSIEFVKGRLEDTPLPVHQVDIIVSEWMGYFLLFEGMLDSVIYARDRYLAPGGRLLPNRCNISLVGLGDERRYGELIDFWNQVYGFDMRTMRDEVLPEASVEICPADQVLTEAQVVSDLDLMTVTESCMDFESPLELRCLRAGKLTALAGYFDTFFELPEAVEFSTGPQARPTHWKQTVFYLPEPLTVAAGDVVRGHFKCRRDRKDVRALFVKIELAGQRALKYYLN